MRRPAFLLTAFAALALVLTPLLAEARPGGSSSSGSRGSRTHSAPPPTQTAPNTARPMERTATQPSAPQTGAPARPAMPPQAQPQRSFMGALAGGLLAGGLIGMMFGGGLLGGGGGFAGMLGMLLQVALIGGLVWLAFRLFRRREAAPAMAGGPAYARQMEQTPPMGGNAGLAPAIPARDVVLTPADYQAFERTLIEVNAAWSRRDLKALRDVATPEMVGYFAQDYRDLDARGWRNETRDIRFEGGDLSEAWHEDGQDYATVALRFSLLDATFEVASGKVVEGSTTERQTATEIWTFMRSGPQERWLLSAIQQTG